jgi:hypothetical protein
MIIIFAKAQALFFFLHAAIATKKIEAYKSFNSPQHNHE